MRERIGLVEALGLQPFDETARDVALALRGDASTPKTRFGLSSLRNFHPRLGAALWLGKQPAGRRVPITNLYNYRQPPPELGWSVRVTDVRDFRGGENTYDSHNGTDFAIPPGTNVVAAAPGTVLRVSSEFHRGGRKILIDHGHGLVTSYNHLSRPLVTPGQRVRRGERIALSGYSGLDALVGFPWAPPHVHFNVWLDGVYVDPFTPEDRDEPSLWRRRNDPVPALPSELDDDTVPPSDWDDDAMARALATCHHSDTRSQIEHAPTPEERAGALLMHLAYFPTRFERDRLGDGFSLFRVPHRRQARLDLPFSHLDYDGVVFLPR
ncbi:MAG: M23 family metallopeptidase [Polyangiaceae bacterium]|nr:M23 family metallopeptidase [Polyangiaceae bacterium]